MNDIDATLILTTAILAEHRQFLTALDMGDTEEGNIALNCSYSSLEDLIAEATDITPALTPEYGTLFTAAYIAAGTMIDNY